jgi:hypothetical protein
MSTVPDCHNCGHRFAAHKSPSHCKTWSEYHPKLWECGRDNCHCRKYEPLRPKEHSPGLGHGIYWIRPERTPS